MNFEDKYVRRGIQTASRTYGGKVTIVFIIPKGTEIGKKGYALFQLEGTGTYLWDMLDEPRQIKEIVYSIAKKKNVNVAQAARGVAAFIKELAKDHLIDILVKPKPTYY